ncbi:GTPase HflX [Saccharospirillum sp. MSK14-1]|uniref:ribosome rescue GTPase HflX n=1 Tax=Saccharospirillum sp. MSK14-1 TaxID=1897632 RepID=UPI000D37772E|nr:ribosome rescue GTPase HflX [Saccharospirillum sp. MSK14-1]PTY35922.1 GTPase HflX [Saccharospirillum sp. MSK14-1]
MFFERVEGGDRAVLVHIDFPESDDREDPQEFEELVVSAGGEPAAFIGGSRSTPHPKYFVGPGKLDEIKAAVASTGADVVLFNHSLSPSQERNVERAVECRVLDRTGLILDIFAQRARTHEGKLQVELAQLQYQSTRLVRGWTHLERQKGGIGLRGPGETQLETDRRLLQARISSIHRRLEKVEKQRNQGRRARSRSDTPTVSLVGYTNAGKSTLFNALTRSEVYAADQLFATLDPTLRRLSIPDMGDIVLADTVGFIRHLPHKLVQAFKATLQETAEADLLLHVIDSADEDRVENIEQVEAVLEEIGSLDIPRLEIFNKIDLLDDFEPAIERDDQGMPVRVWVSAQRGDGLALIQAAIAERLGDDIIAQQLALAPSESALRAALYQQNAVLGEAYDDAGNALLDVRIQKKDLKQLVKHNGLDLERFGLAEPKAFFEH